MWHKGPIIGPRVKVAVELARPSGLLFVFLLNTLYLKLIIVCRLHVIYVRGDIASLTHSLARPPARPPARSLAHPPAVWQ